MRHGVGLDQVKPRQHFLGFCKWAVKDLGAAASYAYGFGGGGGFELLELQQNALFL